MRGNGVTNHNATAIVAGNLQVEPIGTGLPRTVEILLSLLGLIISAPLLFVSAIAIAVTSRGPVIFRQERVGRRGRAFVLYKLRTMRREAGPQVTAGDDLRVTFVGRVLRKTKLDELPELWNVFKGDMSLVGPRPELPCYVDLQNPMWRLVLEARPGLTDPMTLRLRNEEVLLAGVQGELEHFYLRELQPFKLRGYVEYLNQRRWWYDVKVLWKSGVAIIFPRTTPPPALEEIAAASGSQMVLPHGPSLIQAGSKNPGGL
jgi:lipopolysaccharide/colanic/teichoic acid biosynthesis glycosyltransferase